MSLPYHLHFVVAGPWSFTLTGDPEIPGNVVSPQFQAVGTFVSVEHADGTVEKRNIPCRIAEGETARVYSQIVPDKLSAMVLKQEREKLRKKPKTEHNLENDE